MNEHVWLDKLSQQNKRKSILDLYIAYMTFTPIASACPPHLGFKFQSDFPADLSSKITSCREIFPFQMLSGTWSYGVHMNGSSKRIHPQHSYVHTHDTPPVFCAL